MSDTETEATKRLRADLESKLLDELPLERDLRDGGQGMSTPGLLERDQARVRRNAAGRGGPVGGPIGRGYEY